MEAPGSPPTVTNTSTAAQQTNVVDEGPPLGMLLRSLLMHVYYIMSIVYTKVLSGATPTKSNSYTGS